MAKIELGKPPANFKKKITFDLPDGTKGDVEFLFKYRTRSDCIKLLNDLNSAEAKDNDSIQDWLKVEFEKADAKSLDIAKKDADKKGITDETEIESIRLAAYKKILDKVKDESIEKAVSLNNEKGISLIKAVADGWDLSDDFNDANITILIDTYPSVVEEVKENYRKVCIEGRAKN